MTLYGQQVRAKATPQTEQAHPDQVANSAGGFSFRVDKWTQLDRFLVLGAEGGTYYIAEKKLVRDNAKNVLACIAEDGVRTVARIVEISDAGRAPKNDPAIFALALCASDKNPATRAMALAVLPKVCRIGTHLFHFVADVTGQRNWSRALRTAVSRWYLERPVDKLAMQLVKYQQRDGWSHRDVLRLAHPMVKPLGGEQTSETYRREAALRWATGGIESVVSNHNAKRFANGEVPAHYKDLTSHLPAIIGAFEAIHAPGVDVKNAIKIITEHRLPHECVPNEMKNDPKVWEALLPHMGLTAIIRNVGKMTDVGLLKPMSEASRIVATKLADSSELFAARVHPLSVLFAMKTYQSGHGLKGKLSWTPVREVVDGLDEAFYASFQHVEPTGKRQMLCLDVSGSMGSSLAGTSLSCREGSAAMAMVAARTEKTWMCMGFSNRFVHLDISPKQRLDDVVRRISGLPFESTDCSLPMEYAIQEKFEIDAFSVYTDSETYAGRRHPHQALEDYRRKSGIPAKLVVVGMESNEFTIANPNDAGMLDVVGFDAAAPGVIADFIAGREVQK